MKNIKNILKPIILFLLFVVISNAQEFDYTKKMEQGNKYFLEKNYEAAIGEYKSVLHNGYESPELYYNLGNSYFRINKLGYSIFYFEKAVKLAPDDDDIVFNLSIANARTIDQIKEVPRLFFIEWWNETVTFFTVKKWSVFVIIFLIIFLAGVYYYLFGTDFKRRKIILYTNMLSLALLILGSVFLISRINIESNTNEAILLESSYVAKISPDEKGNDSFLIHEGIKVTIEDELQGWYKIKLADGKIGWVPKATLGRI